MVFCGKCGFQLSSGNITCPRCGTPTETELIFEESHPDSTTIASSANFGVNQPYPGTQGTISPDKPVEQQPLILGSNPYDFGIAEQSANEAAGKAYPGYMPQSAANYPQQGASYQGYTMQGGTNYQQFGASLEDAEKVRSRGRIVGLLLILIGLLFILGAMVLFILTHNSSASASSSVQQMHATFAVLCPPTCSS